MNQTFNLNRFIMLFKKHTVEQCKTYLMSIVVLIGLFFVSLGFIAFDDRDVISEVDQYAVFGAFLLLGGCIFTSNIFSDFGEKRKAIQALTLPASHLEKYLVAWVYSFLIFQVIYVSAFYLVAPVVVAAENNSAVEKAELLNIFSSEKHIAVIFLMYSVLHAIAFWGALFFEKFNFIKTAFSVFALLLVLTLLNGPILKSMIYAEILSYVPFSAVRIMESNIQWQVKLTDPDSGIIFITVCLLVMILWISAFFRLKEKQV